MAVVVVIAHTPGGSAEQHEASIRALQLADDPPAGNLVWLAGPVEGGWRVISVWESQEAWDAFRCERLRPVLRQAGQPPQQFHIAPLRTVRIAPSSADPQRAARTVRGGPAPTPRPGGAGDIINHAGLAPFAVSPSTSGRWRDTPPGLDWRLDGRAMRRAEGGIPCYCS